MRSRQPIAHLHGSRARPRLRRCHGRGLKVRSLRPLSEPPASSPRILQGLLRATRHQHAGGQVGFHRPRRGRGVRGRLSWNALKAGLRNAKAKGRRLGRPQIVVDVARLPRSARRAVPGRRSRSSLGGVSCLPGAFKKLRSGKPSLWT
jgi:hypothetical protein